MSILNNVSENVSIILSGISPGDAIPISIQQVTEPYQFWVTVGVTLTVGVGMFAVPFMVGGSNPLKKAKNIKAFNTITGRPSLIIDHSKSGLFTPKMIDNKTITETIRAMTMFNGRDFNLIITSGGGSVFAAQAISDAILKYPGKVHVYIPKYAMSGASLLALSSDQIHMTEYSALGMIDPQLGSMLSQASAKGWNEVVKMKGAKANDASILHNITGQQVTKSIRENVKKVITGKTNQSEKVADYFTNGNHEHIKRVSMSDLHGMGFNNLVGITPHENKLLVNIVG